MKIKSDTLLQLPGYFLVCSFITTAISGLLLAYYYAPSPQSASFSIEFIHENIFAGSVVVTMHHISGIGVILFTLINLGIVMFSEKNHTWLRIWQTGIVLIALYFGVRITGHLLLGNSSSVYLLKLIITRLTGTTLQSIEEAALNNTLSVALARVYVLHILILPGITGYVIYLHIKSMKQLGSDLEPLLLRPNTLLVLFTTIVIILSIFIKPSAQHVAIYGESWHAHAPWEIQVLAWVSHTLSFPGTIFSILALFILLFLSGYAVRKLKS